MIGEHPVGPSGLERVAVGGGARGGGGGGDDGGAPAFLLSARALDHRVDTLGWRIDEPPGRTMLPDRLAGAGVPPVRVGELQRDGVVEIDGRSVHLEEVSVERPAQSFAFVMDTAPCDAAVELAKGVEVLVCEGTFSAGDAALASAYKHMTTVAAAELARQAGVGLLVLTHFSQRYPDVQPLVDEARRVFPSVVGVSDLDRIPLPRRVRPVG